MVTVNYLHAVKVKVAK